MAHPRSRTSGAALVVAFVVLLVAGILPAAAEQPDGEAFLRTWARTDRPVAEGVVNRTWMWGPEATGAARQEAYAEAPGGTRSVQYFDKTRMEDNGYRAAYPWNVTNGLLVVELVSGRLQLGDDTFEQYLPAEVNVAGDADDPTGPTYRTFAALGDDPPLAEGAPIIQRLARDGTVTDDPALAASGVTAARLYDVPGLRHRVASTFWAFMTSSGIVYEAGAFATGPLFPDPIYATGLPISEAYWANVKVGGQYRDVLMQCFERRCLTYTPDNPEGWKVEAGNVGQHYQYWRYVELPTLEPIPCPEVTAGETIYVSENDRFRVQKFAADGDPLCGLRTGAPPEYDEYPKQVKVDAEGNVYVMTRGLIRVHDARGVYLREVAVHENTTDFAIDEQQRVVTTNSASDSVVIYDLAGAIVDELGATPGTLSYPFGVAVGEDGRVFVLDRGYRMVIVFSPGGSVLDSFGGTGAASSPDSFDTPSGIGVAADGTVYVSDLGWIKSFQVMGSAYQPAGSWGGTDIDSYAGDGRLEVLGGLAGEPLRVYVTDVQYNLVRVWRHDADDDATELLRFGGPGDALGQLNEPWGIAVDPGVVN